MSDSPDTELVVLSVPAALEEDLVAALRGLPAQVTGFSLFAAEGVGAGLALASAFEQVRGRARRALFLVALDATVRPSLLDTLASRFPSPDIVWWVVPVAATGRFAR